MALSKCIFCGCEQDDYKGLHLIKNDGAVVYYCSSKCRKNHLKLGRDRKKFKWTAAYRETKVKHEAAEARKVVAADAKKVAALSTKKN